MLEEAGIRSPDPYMIVSNICMEDVLHFEMTVGWEQYDHHCDKIEDSEAIPSDSGRRWATIELNRVVPGTSDVDRYESDDGDNVDTYLEDEASQGDDK
jgi:hypothetical protein